MTELVDATERAIKAAKHLTDMDIGAVQSLRILALKIDADEERWERLADDAAENKLRPPSIDNVSIPTYLKYCEALGLTPAGRLKISTKQPEGGGASGGSALGKLRSVHAGTAS